MSGAGEISWLQSGLALAAVLGLLFAAAGFAKRFRGIQPGSNALLKTVGGISVGARERIVVVEIGEEWLVVGVSPGGLRTLHVTARRELLPPGPPPFREWIDRAMNRKAPGREPS